MPLKDVEKIIEKEEEIVKTDILKAAWAVKQRTHKYLFNVSNTIKELIAVYLVILVIAALGYSYFEQKSFFESLWWACVTAMTIGYGDTYPVTTGGRIVAVTLMHIVPLLLIPLITTHLTSRFITNALADKIQEEILEDLRELVDWMKEEKAKIKKEK